MREVAKQAKKLQQGREVNQFGSHRNSSSEEENVTYGAETFNRKERNRVTDNKNRNKY